MKKILFAMLCAVFCMNLYGAEVIEVTRNGVTRRTFTQPNHGVINVIRLYKKGNIEVRPFYSGKNLNRYIAWRRRTCRRNAVEHSDEEAQELYKAFEKEFNEPEKDTSLSQMIRKVCCSRKKRD